MSFEEYLEHYMTKEYIERPFCKTNSLKIRKSICKLPNFFYFCFKSWYKCSF